MDSNCCGCAPRWYGMYVYVCVCVCVGYYRYLHIYGSGDMYVDFVRKISGGWSGVVENTARKHIDGYCVVFDGSLLGDGCGDTGFGASRRNAMHRIQ